MYLVNCHRNPCHRNPNPTFGTYFGTDARFCGSQVCTSGAGGVAGAFGDYEAIAVELGTRPNRPEIQGGSVRGISFTWLMAQTPTAAGILGLRVYPNVYSGGQFLLNQRAVIDIPRGAFSGQTYRIRVHYYGPGNPGF